MGLGMRWVPIWAVIPMEAAEAPRVISADLLVSRPVSVRLLGCGPMIGWYVIFFKSCPWSRRILQLFRPLWLIVVSRDVVVVLNFFRRKIYDWLKKDILLMCINFLYSRPEVLRGVSCAKTHFIYCLGDSRLVNIRSNATLLQSGVCLLSETVNWERSKFCYITTSF